MIQHRYRRIVLFFARIILSFIIWDLVFPRIWLRGWSRRTRTERLRNSARSFRSLAIQLGGVMIKVGQFLSTRVDVLPQEITSELAGLQDEVPPERFDDIRRVAEEEFGLPLAEKFEQFEETPLAAASLGQVHRARILAQPETSGGEGEIHSQAPNSFQAADGYLDVVVKIQRPEIEQLIETDLAALRTVGGWLRHYGPIRRRADIPALLAEFTRILYEEVDYLAEGQHAEVFAANFSEDPGVRVPEVVWSHTTRRVLTLQNVWGIKITDYEAIAAAGIDRGEVASRLLDTYLKQIFEDGFFHADPHPGNLFVAPCPSEDGSVPPDQAWQLTFVDFGMVSYVSPKLLEGLREMLIAVGTRDAARLAKSTQMIGVLLPSADTALLEKAEAKVLERYWGKNMSELQKISPQEVRELAVEFRELIYTMPFQIPHDLIFLGRAVGILSGICTGLDPQFNAWEHLAPYAKKLVVEETLGSREFWLEELRKVAQSLLAIPVKLDAMLVRLEHGEVAVRAPDVVRQVQRLESAIRLAAGGIVFAAFLLGGIQLYLGGEPLFGNLLLGGAGLSFVWMFFASRSRK